MTDRKDFKKIVQQGGGWGGILCSNTVDTLEKKSSSSLTIPTSNSGTSSKSSSVKKDSYLYKGVMTIPVMSYIDDINKVEKCGIDSLQFNTFISKQIKMNTEILWRVLL